MTVITDFFSAEIGRVLGECFKEGALDSDSIEINFNIRATFDDQKMVSRRARGVIIYTKHNGSLFLKRDGEEPGRI